MIRRVNQKVHATGSTGDASDVQQRLAMARQHGDFTIVYSTICQPGLSYHFSNGGYLAYDRKWGYDFALGDPVVESGRLGSLIDEFIADCKRKPCFANITENTAAELADRGYYINQMGVDTWLELNQYDFKGKQKEPFRYAANWLRKRQYRIVESDLNQVDESRIRELSRRWRATRTVKHREVGFLNRPLVLESESDVRRFFLYDKQDRMLAFVFLDPVYRAGKIVGYSTVFKRRDPEAPTYAEQGIMKHCIEKLKLEGVETLRLGLSPLANMTDTMFKRNPLLHFGWSYGYKAWWVNRYYYNLQGHAEFKRRFRGIEKPVYFATPVLFNDVRIAALLRLMGLLGGEKS